MSVSTKRRVTSRALLDAANPNVAIGSGQVPGLRHTNLLGINTDVDNSSPPETVWAVGGLYPFPTGAFSATIESDDPNDSLLGTGAQKVVLRGLDTSYQEIIEVLDLDGTTDVISARSDWFRINSCFVLQQGAGLTQTNLGTITIKEGTGATTILGVIRPDEGKTRMGHYTSCASDFVTPIHATAQLLQGAFGSEVELGVFTRIDGGPWILNAAFGLQTLGTSGITFEPPIPEVLAPKTDIDVRVIDADANNLAVAIFVQLLLVDTDLIS